MTVHIWALQKIGIGKEATKGTSAATDYWIPKVTGSMKPVLEQAEDRGAYGTIDDLYDTQLVKETTETMIEGIVRDDFIGTLLMAAFGQSAVSWAWPTYTHSFTRKNDNDHPSLTVHGTDSVGSWYSAYSMLNELTINATSGDFVKFSASFVGKKMTSESTPSVSFTDANPFRARDVKVYFADDEAGLAVASETKVERLSLTIAKNLEVYQALGSEDVEAIYNQQFGIVGDFEALFSDTTLLDYVRNDTTKWCKISIINADVDLWGWVNPQIDIVLSKMTFDDWGRTDDNATIVRQTLGFKALHNATEWYSAKATLINTVSTDYDA